MCVCEKETDKEICKQKGEDLLALVGDWFKDQKTDVRHLTKQPPNCKHVVGLRTNPSLPPTSPPIQKTHFNMIILNIYCNISTNKLILVTVTLKYVLRLCFSGHDIYSKNVLFLEIYKYY